MTEEIPELDRKGLRDFGLLFGAFFATLFGVLFPYLGWFTWLSGEGWPLWPWLLLAVMLVWSFAAPDTLRPLYRGWMTIGMAIGGVVNRVVLGLVFYLVILPIGLIFKARGNDPMRRRLDGSSPSYRVPSAPSKRENLEKPF